MQTELIAPAERAGLLRRLVAGELPDARGRFGPFGGRYAPETLIPALERLEAGLRRYLRDPEYPGRAGPGAARVGGPPDRAQPRAHAQPPLGCQRLSQARGPGPHGRPQDQQRARPGAAGEAPRREARHRGDRRRPARRGHGRRLRAGRHPLHRLHGRRGRAAPGAERGAHGAARRRGGAGEERRPDAARGHRRGLPRLGLRSGRQLLPAGLRRRARTPIRCWCASCSP